MYDAIRLRARLEGVMTDPGYEGKAMQGPRIECQVLRFAFALAKGKT